jgi:hypothetical protein
MKRKYIYILSLLLVVAGIRFAKADQLQWLTKDQAEKTVEYFEDNDIKRVILWCACCDNNRMEKVKVTKIYFRKAEDPNYYEVIIEGTGADSRKINEAVDLAYVHIKKNKKAYCLGKELGFECDPCTTPFKW